MRRLMAGLFMGAAVAAAAVWSGAPAKAEPMPAGWQASHMRPVGYIHLPGPRAFKLSMKRVGARWYLFVAEGGQGADLPQEGRGFHVVDVTDPANPKIVATVPVEHGGGQVTSHDNLLIAAVQTPYPPGSKHLQEAPWGGVEPAVHDLAVLFDISDPVHPKELSRWRTEGWSTHRNVYPGGKYAFMAAYEPGWRGNSVMTVLDVSDPTHPKAVGRWWQTGQKEDEPPRPPPNGFHGPVTVSPDGKMLTMGYAPSLVNLDFADPAHPKLIGKVDFSPLPLSGAQSIHTGLPISHGMAVVTIEATPQGCTTESAAWAAMVDNHDPAHPRLAGYFPRPAPPPGAPYKSFCDKGGRVGPHNVNAEIHLPEVQAPGDLIFMTYFTAGIRVFDISDPYTPKETGWFLPPVGAWETGDRGLEDVLVDKRGYAYTTQGTTGRLWILRYENPNGPQLPSTEGTSRPARRKR